MSATISQQTLPQKAADAIIRLIRTQNYAAGTKLPNEYELSRMLNVSRNTVFPQWQGAAEARYERW